MIRHWVAGLSLLALAGCNASQAPTNTAVASNALAPAADANALAANDAALPPPLPAPPAAAPLPAAPARYAEPWRAARDQAARIERERGRYRRAPFYYGRGSADAWREGGDVVRTTDPDGRTFYYRPGEDQPYWATSGDRSYAYEDGRPAYGLLQRRAGGGGQRRPDRARRPSPGGGAGAEARGAPSGAALSARAAERPLL